MVLLPLMKTEKTLKNSSMRSIFLRNILFIALAGIISLHPCFGQNLREDIAKINANYSSQNSFKLQMKISLLEDDKVIESKIYSYAQNKTNSYFKIDKTITVVLGKISLLVDENTKNIILSPTPKNTLMSISGSYDTLLDIVKSYKLEVLDSGKKNQYTLNFKKQAYKKIEIVYSPIDFQLISVRIYYSKVNKKDPQKVLEFSYGKVSNLTNADKKKLTKGTYLKSSNKQPKLSAQYNNYDLIDYRSFYQE